MSGDSNVSGRWHVFAVDDRLRSLLPAGLVRAKVYYSQVAVLGWLELSADARLTADDGIEEWKRGLRDCARILRMAAEDAGIAPVCELVVKVLDGAEADGSKHREALEELAKDQVWHRGEVALFVLPAGTKAEEFLRHLMGEGVSTDKPRIVRTVGAREFVESLVSRDLPSELTGALANALKGERRDDRSVLADVVGEWNSRVLRDAEAATEQEDQG